MRVCWLERHNGRVVRSGFFENNCLASLLCAFLSGFIFSGNVAAADIAIFGDTYEPIERKIVQAIIPFKPSAVLTVGDNVDDGDDPKQWVVFNEINAPLLKMAEYFPALGDHENDSPLYFDNFPFLRNRRWYSLDREGIHFSILDSNSNLLPGSEQYQWLEVDLKEAKDQNKLRVIVLHHPLFNVVKRREDEEEGLRSILLPLFKQYGVAVVFSGHRHSYQRFSYGGIYFIVTAGGGARLEEQVRTSPYLQKFKSAPHFCLLTHKKGVLRIRAIDVDSNIIDDVRVKTRR